MFNIRTKPFAALLALSSLATAQDPFDMGIRWSHYAPAKTPWVPSSVAFGARESLALVTKTGVNTSIAALDAFDNGISAPTFEDVGTASLATHMATAPAWDGDAFTVLQFPDPTLSLRRTTLVKHDISAAVTSNQFTPAWSHDSGLRGNGSARLAADKTGRTVALAAFDSATTTVQVDLVDGTTGTLLSRNDYSSFGLNAIQVSEDGETIAMAAGLDLYVFDRDGNTTFHQPLSTATNTLCLSADGSTLAWGGMGAFSLLKNDSGTWTPAFTASQAPHWIATAADLSFDGDKLALAWWHSSNGVDVRFEMWNVATGTLTTYQPLYGNHGGPQNLPQTVDVTPNGEIAAFGTWGNGNFPEVMVLGENEALPLYSVDTPGSVRDLELSEDGQRVLVGFKNTHNNVFSNRGGVWLYESGSHQMNLLNSARTGEDLTVATFRPNSNLAFLLLGERAAPVQFPGVAGTLKLDRATLSVQLQATQQGRSDFTVSIPDDPALIGTQLSLQAAWRAQGGTVLSDDVLDPIIID